MYTVNLINIQKAQYMRFVYYHPRITADLQAYTLKSKPVQLYLQYQLATVKWKLYQKPFMTINNVTTIRKDIYIWH